MKKVTLDLESRSECELKKAGGWEYSKHPTTEIICVAYKIDHEPTKIFYPFWGEEMPEELVLALLEEDRIRVAHNAFFEESMFANCYEKYLPVGYVGDMLSAALAWNPKRWRCTAAKARSHSFPGALEKACQALKLPVQKDTVGHKLMLRLCKPRKTWLVKGTGDKYFGSREDFLRLGEYCITDTNAEYLIDETLPNLSEYENKVWQLDQKINRNGVQVDVDTCKLVLGMIEKETLELKAEVTSLTLGIVESASQRAELLEFVQSERLEIPNLQAKTVQNALDKGGMSELARRLLEIRQVVSKTSTAKYKRFIERAGSDSRVRDLLVYHGPSTGRWSGSGVQPQNFPRGFDHDSDNAIEVILQGDIELIRLIYSDPMTTFSSCLRGMITASPGKRLFAADYNAIETRVLWWVAGNLAGLDRYRNGIDNYCAQASELFKRVITKFDKDERFLGKELTLGAGYGLGPPKFKLSCEKKGLVIPLELAKEGVKSYRELNPEVPELWDNLERAALYAVKNPTKKVRTNKVAFFMRNNFLYCELPSGRLLAYPYPSIKGVATPWGEVRPKLFYWGTNSFTRKWEEENTWGGKLAENIVQAISRDIMVHGMFNAETAEYEVILTVHDEIVSEKEEGSLDEFIELITDLPDWCLDCPIEAGGFHGRRYRK